MMIQLNNHPRIPMLNKIILVYLLASYTTTLAFTPSNQRHVVLTQTTNSQNTFTTSTYSSSPTTFPSITSSRQKRSSDTKLNFGVIVPVPDDFFTIAGISLGFAYTITRSWNRVVVENVAWEKRLEDARMRKLDGEDDESSMVGGANTYTELDLRKMDAEASQSSYGPEAMERRRSKRRSRVRTLELDDDEYDEVDFDDDDDDDRKGRSSDRSYTMTDEQINDFEEQYGVAYDPYYDEPYTEDELPDDVSFVEDKVYGDRRYQNGEIFYRDENDKRLYWRQGGRPRLKQFWELF